MDLPNLRPEDTKSRSKMSIIILLGFVLLPIAIAQKSPSFVSYTSVRMGSIDVRGTREYEDMRGVRYEARVFRGIPYAEPPVGERRFKPPVKKPRPNASFDATQFGNACMQSPSGIATSSDALAHKNMSEDCLYLNIYAPDKGTQKAVMVYFHGGAWGVGSGMLHATPLAAYGDVVVVTLNYRLGPFGYLSTGDSNARGNYGLKDQMMALDWVRENIGYFGGDPNAITLFGGSSGSFDLTLHAMLQKPGGQYPIKRCISSSGTFITPSPVSETFKQKPRPYAEGLAARLGCNTTENPTLQDTKRLVECLKAKPANDIIKASNFYLNDDPYYEILWTPSQDGDLIKAQPSDLFKKDLDIFRGFKSVDLMTGSTSGDGDVLYALMARKGKLSTVGVKPPNLDVPKDKLEPLIAGVFKDWPNAKGIAKAAQHQYTPPGTFTGRDGRNAMVDLLSDEVLIMPTIATARVHERMNPARKTYMYFFDSVIFTNPFPFRPEKPGHRTELEGLFGPFSADPSKPPVKPTGLKEEVSLAMITYWTNFAKYGNPNGDGKKTSKPTFTTWPEFTLESQQYLNIAANKTQAILTAKKNLRPQSTAFWLEYLPYLTKQCHTQTCSTPTCPPILDQYISSLRLTARQAQVAIIVLAALFTVCLLLCATLLLVYCRMRGKMNAAK